MNIELQKLHDKTVDKLQEIIAMEGNKIDGWFGETVDALISGRVINNLYIDGSWPSLKLVNGEIVETDEVPTFNGHGDLSITEAI